MAFAAPEIAFKVPLASASWWVYHRRCTHTGDLGAPATVCLSHFRGAGAPAPAASAHLHLEERSESNSLGALRRGVSLQGSSHAVAKERVHLSGILGDIRVMGR